MKQTINPGREEIKINMLEDVTYATVPCPVCGGTRPLEMTVVMPSEKDYPPADLKRPALLWIPGGAWMRAQHRKWIAELAVFAKQGYVFAAANYRNSSEAVFPAQIEDVLTAVRYLRAHAGQYGIDPERIGIFGCSAGGHLTALASMNPDCFGTEDWAEYPSAVQAAVELYGPTDLAGMFAYNLRDKAELEAGRIPYRPMLAEEEPEGFPECRLIGARVDEAPELAAKADPLNYINPNACPLMILHGDSDATVPLYHGERLYEALEAAGHGPEMYVIEGAGHSTPEFSQASLRGLIREFFDKHLMNE